MSRSGPVRDRVGNEWVRDAVGESFTLFAKSAVCVGANAKSQNSERFTDGPPDGSKSRFYSIIILAVAALPAGRFRRNSASEELIWACLRSPSLSCSGHREAELPRSLGTGRYSNRPKQPRHPPIVLSTPCQMGNFATASRRESDPFPPARSRGVQRDSSGPRSQNRPRPSGWELESLLRSLGQGATPNPIGRR